MGRRLNPRLIQGLLGASFVLSLAWAWLLAFPLFNRLFLLWNRSGYEAATFEVDGAEMGSDVPGRGVPDRCCWLTGLVEGQKERFVPRLRGAPSPPTVDDLLAGYPRGTRIKVQYNPAATHSLLQGQSLRVIEGDPGMWEEERRLAWRLGRLSGLPALITGTLYGLARISRRRRALGFENGHEAGRKAAARRPPA